MVAHEHVRSPTSKQLPAAAERQALEMLGPGRHLRCLAQALGMLGPGRHLRCLAQTGTYVAKRTHTRAPPP
eukprot:364314-Chlamydomonas_euryale.AAC.6